MRGPSVPPQGPHPGHQSLTGSLRTEGSGSSHVTPALCVSKWTHISALASDHFSVVSGALVGLC